MSFLAAAAVALRRGDQRPLPRPALVTAACLLAIGFLGLFQLLPLPPRLVRALSPASAEVYSGAASILGKFGSPPAPAPRLSIAPSETRAVALLAVSTAAAFLAAASLLVSRTRRRVFAVVLLVSMAAQAAWAAATEQDSGRVSGPFFNPDHFAGYLGIGLALAFGGLVIGLTGRARQRGPIHSVWLEGRVVAGALGVVLWGFFASAVALTQSRGGMLAATATTLLLAGLAIGARASRDQGVRPAPRATLVAGLALGVLFVVTALGSRPLLRFLATDPRDLGEDTRVLLWTHALEAWKSYPVFGSGLGTFREAFRVVQPRELVALVESAHGDFLQLLVTGGAVGALIGVAAWVSLAHFLLRGTLLRIRQEEGVFALTGLGALVSVALHGLVEFNLSIPATSATLALVAGAAVAALRDAETRAGRGPARTGKETTATP
jgi:O-antigen ligase